MSEEKRSSAVLDRVHFRDGGSAHDAAEPINTEDPAVRDQPEGASQTGDNEMQDDDMFDLSHLLISIAAGAGPLLSGKESAASTADEDALGVRRIISILEMLRDKTEGRRNDEETRLLEHLVSELKMTYVTVFGKGRA